MGAGGWGQGPQDLVKVQLYPGNNRKVLMSFLTGRVGG